MGGIEEEEGGEEFCDTCVLVDSVSSSSVAWGAHLCGGNGKRSIGCGPVPGGRIFLPPSPGGLFSENPEPGCVYMVWPYPVWRGCVYMVQFSLRPGSQL